MRGRSRLRFGGGRGRSFRRRVDFLEIFFGILVELLEAAFAAETHEAHLLFAIHPLRNEVIERFAHRIQLVAGDDADLEGIAFPEGRQLLLFRRGERRGGGCAVPARSRSGLRSG